MKLQSFSPKNKQNLQRFCRNEGKVKRNKGEELAKKEADGEEV